MKPIKKKSLTIRIPKEIWVFLKGMSIKKECSINETINQCLKKYKENIENLLISTDTMVS